MNTVWDFIINRRHLFRGRKGGDVNEILIIRYIAPLLANAAANQLIRWLPERRVGIVNEKTSYFFYLVEVVHHFLSILYTVKPGENPYPIPGETSPTTLFT